MQMLINQAREYVFPLSIHHCFSLGRTLLWHNDGSILDKQILAMKRPGFSIKYIPMLDTKLPFMSPSYLAAAWKRSENRKSKIQ